MSDAETRALERASTHDPVAAARLEIARDRADPLRPITRAVDGLIVRARLDEAGSRALSRVTVANLISDSSGRPFWRVRRADEIAWPCVVVPYRDSLVLGLARIRLHFYDDGSDRSISDAWPSLSARQFPNRHDARFMWDRPTRWARRQLTRTKRCKSVVVLDSKLARAWATAVLTLELAP